MAPRLTQVSLWQIISYYYYFIRSYELLSSSAEDYDLDSVRIVELSLDAFMHVILLSDEGNKILFSQSHPLAMACAASYARGQ